MASPDSTLNADLAQKLHVKAIKHDYVLEPRLGAETEVYGVLRQGTPCTCTLTHPSFWLQSTGQSAVSAARWLLWRL